jgi:epoxyqueuosine reductase QueG
MLYKQIQSLVGDLGADVFGVADLTPARSFILERGINVFPEYRSGISFGIFLNHSIVNQLPNSKNPAIAMLYRHHCYNVINDRLDSIGSRISNLLQEEGFDAIPIPASQATNENRFDGLFTHKVAASLAGIGWIGKNHLLITPSNGPRVRLATVLTNASLVMTEDVVLPSNCGDCTLCEEICPSGALHKPESTSNGHTKFQLDRHSCHQYLENMESTVGYKACGLCLYVCPYGRETHSL